eukprot:g1115.t1
MEQSQEKKPKPIPTVSHELPDGTLVELTYQPDKRRTAFVVGDPTGWTIERSLTLPDGTELIPVPATNNLIRHGVVHLASEPAEYADMPALAQEIEQYIHRYLDLSPTFERIAAYYVLLSWLYDRFNELPYLRFIGDYGTGKSRALIVVGSLCYKSFFASGASTVSPIFHTLNTFGGTLILDEADFRFSDEKAELVKILNNGNVRGFPVLRTSVDREGTFDPRAYHVFGPKLVAARKSFQDEALESRFLTEEMGARKLRADIPINLPDEQQQEAQVLRNKLLLFRFRNHVHASCDPAHYDPTLEARLNQVLTPLLSVISDEALRDDIRRTMAEAHTERTVARSASPEGHVVAVLLDLLRADRTDPITIAEVAERVFLAYGAEYERPITNRWIGGIIREKLRLATYKTGGVYVVPPLQFEKIRILAERYRIAPSGENVSQDPERDVGM